MYKPRRLTIRRSGTRVEDKEPSVRFEVKQVTQHIYNSEHANAVQNAARRYLGPRLPATAIKHDALMRLYQVRGDVSAQVGDRAIIEEISPSPAKVTFSSEDV